MAKHPRWLKVSAPYFEGGKWFVNLRVRPRHPSFLWYMWKMFRQEIRKREANPNHPRLLWFTARQVVKIAVKAEL